MTALRDDDHRTINRLVRHSTSLNTSTSSPATYFILFMLLSCKCATAAPLTDHHHGISIPTDALPPPSSSSSSSVPIIRHPKSSLIISAEAPPPPSPQEIYQQHQNELPTSALAKRLIYQSPPQAENIYKEFIVGSKPVKLHNSHSSSPGMATARGSNNRPIYGYGNSAGGPKRRKKTKKDSKIYYIPIPPMPYRYTPNIGWDYQPMKIKPIMMEPPKSSSTTTTTTTTTTSTTTERPQMQASLMGEASSDSIVYHIKPPRSSTHYRFNGRPQRLMAAHAHLSRANALTPNNLKANFYFNKPIIY